MNLWSRRVTRLVCLISAAAVVGACSGAGNGPRERKLVGVALLTETHAFYKELEEALRSEAAARDLDVVIVACEMDPARQASQIEDFVTQRVDAILAAPCDSSAIVPYLQRATDAGIPVFTADIAARGGGVVSHVASDNVEGGRIAARALANRLDGKGDVLIIDHPEVASVQDRTRGFDEEIAKYPGIRVVARPSASGQRARAMAVMEDMLQAHRNLRGIFAINDDSALGALAVLEAAKRRDVIIVGFDATLEAQDAIRRGSALVADVAQHPTEIGRTAARVIADHLAGQAVEQVIAVPVSLFTADSITESALAPVTPR